MTRTLMLPDGGKFELPMPRGSSRVSGPALAAPVAGFWLPLGIGIAAGVAAGATAAWLLARRR